MASIRDHILSLNGLTPDSTRTLCVETHARERLPDMQIPAADGYRTACCPSYWSLFQAADWAARQLGRCDLRVWFAA
jgi:hypothetical protein